MPDSSPKPIRRTISRKAYPIIYRNMDAEDQRTFRFWVLGDLRKPSTRAVLRHGIEHEYQTVAFYGRLLEWIEDALICPHSKLNVQPASGRMRYAILCWACHIGYSFNTLKTAALWRLDTKEAKNAIGYKNYHSLYHPLR